MKILFMGTPDFAVFSLRSLLESNHEVLGVITQPDKPKGRGYALLPPPVKSFALEKATERFSCFSLFTPRVSPPFLHPMCSVQGDFTILLCANRASLCQGMPPNIKLPRK